jgi:hypothetical protein
MRGWHRINCALILLVVVQVVIFAGGVKIFHKDIADSPVRTQVDWHVVISATEDFQDMLTNWLYWYHLSKLAMPIILVADDDFIYRTYKNDPNFLVVHQGYSDEETHADSSSIKVIPTTLRSPNLHPPNLRHSRPPEMMQLNVTVPEHLSANQQVMVVLPGGSEVAVAAPAGAKPGEVFVAEIPLDKTTYHSSHYLRVVSQRGRHILKLLKKQQSVIYSDIDTVWRGDPSKYMTGEYDMWAQDDRSAAQKKSKLKLSILHSDGLFWGPVRREPYYCTGLIAFRANERSIRLIELWDQELSSRNQLNQPALNDLISAKVVPGFRHRALPETLFPSGEAYFIQSWGQVAFSRMRARQENKRPTATEERMARSAREKIDGAVVVHNNYIQGFKSKVTRFQCAGLWYERKEAPDQCSGFWFSGKDTDWGRWEEPPGAIGIAMQWLGLAGSTHLSETLQHQHSIRPTDSRPQAVGRLPS